jgi:IPT/TIG domain
MWLAATHTSDARVTNSTNVSLEIAPADDVDKDYVKNAVDNCPEFPNGDQHDDDRDGVGDPCDPTPRSPVAILDFHPKQGPAGTTVTISGKAFGETIALNRVTFGHVPAKILKATTTELVVIVPEGAPSVLIFVHAPRGTVGSPALFHHAER